MPLIQVSMFPGRTDAQKRAMVEKLTEAFIETAGGNPASVEVMITEIDQGNWSQGGVLFADKESHGD